MKKQKRRSNTIPPRVLEMWKLRQDGKTLAEVGKHFRISKVRAHQLLKKYELALIGEWGGPPAKLPEPEYDWNLGRRVVMVPSYLRKSLFVEGRVRNDLTDHLFVLQVQAVAMWVAITRVFGFGFDCDAMSGLWSVHQASGHSLGWLYKRLRVAKSLGWLQIYQRRFQWLQHRDALAEQRAQREEDALGDLSGQERAQALKQHGKPKLRLIRGGRR